MTNIRDIVRDWLPPGATRIVDRIRGSSIRFEGNYTTWADASSKCAGYDAASILDKVLDATQKVTRGEAAFERDSVPFGDFEYAWPVLTGLMWAAARNRGVLNVLDFGGSLGSSFFQNRKFLHSLHSFHWGIVEQANFVQTGQKYFQTENLEFYDSIDSYLLNNTPNVVLLSSVLQYLPQPYKVLERLSSCKNACLIIDRTSFSSQVGDRLVIQRIPANIYLGSYPMWIFGRNHFRNFLNENWSLLATTSCPEGTSKTADGLRFEFEGFILDSKK